MKSLLVRLGLIAAVNALIVGVADAQAGPPQGNSGLITTPVNTAGGVLNLVCAVAAWMFWFILAISVIMMIYAAFSYVTAGDDTEKTSRARRTITYAAIGIVVALLADQLPNIVASFFSGYGSITSSGRGYC